MLTFLALSKGVWLVVYLCSCSGSSAQRENSTKVHVRAKVTKSKELHCITEGPSEHSAQGLHHT